MAAAGIGVATTAVTALSKVALDSYANYEQLVGGVETLFGATEEEIQRHIDAFGEYDSSFEQLQNREQTVLNNAANAYKTAGLSANEYMETVNSFAASLTSSLGEYAWQAANYADVAVTDMSDTANKMGTDMSMIQNAYQGFAKGNFTMLDNLKLGFGGTKTEMERLLRTAEELEGYEIGSLSIDNFADIIDAIHIVQTEMGITGTTAKEAASTISGSLSAAKSAWSNLLTGIADENANMDTLIGNFVDSVSTAAGNILPRVEQILSGIGQMVSKMAPLVGEAVTMLVSDVLPQFITAGADLIGALGSALLEQSDLLIQNALDMILLLAEGLANGAPAIADGAARIIESLALWLAEYSTVLLEAGVKVIAAIVSGVIQALPTLQSAAQQILVAFSYLASDLPEILETGVAIINEMVNGILSEIPNMVSQLPAIFEAIVGFVMSNLPMILEAGIAILLNLADGIARTIPQLIPVWLDAINQILQTIQENLPRIIQMGFDLLLRFVDGIANATSNLVSQIYQIRDVITSGLSEAIDRVFDIGANIVHGLWNGISSMWGWLVDQVSGMVDSVIGVFTDMLDIHSPSRVFRDKIGGNIVLGLAEGITSNAGKAYRAMEDMTSNLMDEAEIPTASYRSSGDFFGTGRSAAGGLILYLYVTITGSMDDESAERYGKIMGEKAAQELRAKGVTA